MIKRLDINIQNSAANLTVSPKQHTLSAGWVNNIPVVNQEYSVCMVVPTQDHQSADVYVFDAPNSYAANEMGMKVRGDDFRDVPTNPVDFPMNDAEFSQPAISGVYVVNTRQNGLLTPCNRQHPLNNR